MPQGYESERREFVRVKTSLSIRYKFLNQSGDDFDEKIYEGVTQNLSGGGLLLTGKIPDLGWIPDLLMQKIVIGVNIMLPDSPEPIKALTRVAWAEAFEEGSGKFAFGLMFREITKEAQDKIFRFIIKSKMPS
ncbi:unnamed protein product [marine sediment metagenome]|uniref:PilZ domain-containing protein n=1 Tax=marine sediment metagenome TaxID=412755 RepID=X0TSP0_9ZZZZ